MIIRNVMSMSPMLSRVFSSSVPYVLPYIWGALLALLIWGAAVSLLYFRPAAGAETCHQINSGDSVAQGYAPPYSVLSSAKTMLVRISCEGTTATITAGSGSDLEYVYRYGYDWVGGMWKQISYTGDEPKGDWYVGRATATVARSAADMAVDNYIVAYVCTWTGTKWKCGCQNNTCSTSSWQLQTFKYEVTASGLFKGHGGELMVAYPSKYYGPAGTQISIAGDGFASSGNTVRFGDKQIQNLPSPSGTSLSFTVPDVPKGRYEVTVKNNKGTADPGTVFWVTTPGATPPSVSSISPTQGGPGTEVVIRGSGFTATGNEVLAGGNNKQNVKSTDGTTLRLTIEGFPGVTEWRNEEGPLHPEFPIWIYVANTNGIAAQPVHFNLKY